LNIAKNFSKHNFVDNFQFAGQDRQNSEYAVCRDSLMPDFIGKLKIKGKAEEDIYFAKRDRELIKAPQKNDSTK